MKILYLLKKSKKNKKGEFPLYCRITINGKRSEIATGIFLKQKDFEQKKQRIKNNHPLSDIYNKFIQQLTYKLIAIYHNELFSGNNPSAAEIKSLYKNKRIVQRSKLLELMRLFSEKQFNISKNTARYKRNKHFTELTKEALKSVYKENISADDCQYSCMDELVYYLRKKKGFSAGYIKKIVQLIKASVKFGYNNGYAQKLPVNYKIPFTDNTEIIYLTEREVEKISKYKFPQARLQRVADCFLVQCFTGLAYIDLKRLSTHNIEFDESGQWININRQKVQSAKMLVPVLKNVKELLEKYNYKMPVISNQRYNLALKEVAREVGIHKNISSHVGRKTFGTLLLNKDVPIETVSRLLGHSNVAVTQKHYAVVLHKKIAKDLRLIL